jgi:ribosomal protein L44E
MDLTTEKEPGAVAEEQAQDIERIKRRLDMLDQRLDNIDSVVTAVAERVLKQPITLNITCPHCGKNIEVAIIGNKKPTV